MNASRAVGTVNVNYMILTFFSPFNSPLDNASPRVHFHACIAMGFELCMLILFFFFLPPLWIRSQSAGPAVPFELAQGSTLKVICGPLIY